MRPHDAVAVAVHGFTQTGAMFDELARPMGGLATPSLPGHGGNASVAATRERAIDVVAAALVAAGAPGPLLGYSMGGRIALHVALQRPDLVSRLVVISASAGIADEARRAERRGRDADLADRIEGIGIAGFIDEWLALPMFAGLARRDAAWRQADRAARLVNTAPGLAGALRGLGQGTLPFVGDRLRELPMPVLLIAGAGDAPYAAHAASMAALIPDAGVVIVPDAGHAVVGERPEVVAAAVATFLNRGSADSIPGAGAP